MIIWSLGAPKTRCLRGKLSLGFVTSPGLVHPIMESKMALRITANFTPCAYGERLHHCHCWHWPEVLHVCLWWHRPSPLRQCAVLFWRTSQMLADVSRFPSSAWRRHPKVPEVSAKDMPVLSKAFGGVCFQSWAFPTFRPLLAFISTGNNNNKKKCSANFSPR